MTLASTDPAFKFARSQTNMSHHADALHATISDAFHMHDEGNKGVSNNFQF
jgi:hypothetical protein